MTPANWHTDDQQAHRPDASPLTASDDQQPTLLGAPLSIIDPTDYSSYIKLDPASAQIDVHDATDKTLTIENTGGGAVAVKLGDGDKLQLGTAPDVDIYYDGANDHLVLEKASGGGLGATWIKDGDFFIGPVDVASKPQYIIVDIAREDESAGLRLLAYDDPVDGVDVNICGGAIFGRARGTSSSPTAVAEGDRLGFFVAQGYNLIGGWSNPAGIAFYVDGTLTDGNVPTKLVLETGSGWPRSPGLTVSSTQLVTIGDGDLRLRSGARVGVKPEIRGSGDYLYLDASNWVGGPDSGRIRLNRYTTGDVTIHNGSSTLVAGFYGSSGNLYVAGNLGVGLTAPDEKLDVDGAVCITDGMTEPATHSGKASIYVDSADGDLKVKFGDGTIKTIVAD